LTPRPDWEQAALCARASEGDLEALGEVVATPGLVRLAGSLGLAPALTLLADDVGGESRMLPEGIPQPWRQSLQLGMTRWLLVREAMVSVAEVLGAAQIPWAPIKGYDVCSRFYDPPEARPTSDVDILVESSRLGDARRALTAADWSGLFESPRSESYLRAEGYAWQATGPSAVLLEVHYRLWGIVEEGLGDRMLAAAGADPELGRTAHRLRKHDVYLLAAVHAWLRETPRSLADWRDLEHILRVSDSGETEQVISGARETSLELPVCLSATVAEKIWPGGGHRHIRDELATGLSARERRVLQALESGGFNSVSTARIALARLLSGRPSRGGWRPVWRRFWPHPGIVERETPDDWWWLRRRLSYLLPLTVPET
jgi:hypothetical protein